MQKAKLWNAHQNEMATIQNLSLRDQFVFAVIFSFKIPQLY